MGERNQSPDDHEADDPGENIDKHARFHLFGLDAVPHGEARVSRR
jgi:hypothetical protein